MTDNAAQSTFLLNGQPIPFEPGDTVIRAAWRQGIEIPHYCWHPGLSVAANCRMCLVEVTNRPGPPMPVLRWDESKQAFVPDQKVKLQPACHMPAAEGLEVSTQSDNVKHTQQAVQEFLLLNHPVDCPICDQAGECKLQDYWLEHQQRGKRKHTEPVHKPKGVRFGETIVYDAERCIMCTRCVRFCDEVVGDHVLDMRQRGNKNEIVLAQGRTLDHRYTLMTEHVCPVGALTSRDFRFKARVWFLKTAPSVCPGCATGCNMYADFDPRTQTVHRLRPRDNEAVNRHWMCDDGMMTYKRIQEDRVLAPMLSREMVQWMAPEATPAADGARRSLPPGERHSSPPGGLRNSRRPSSPGAMASRTSIPAGDASAHGDASLGTSSALQGQVDRVPVPADAVIQTIARALEGAESKRIAFVLSAQHASEDNFALVRLAAQYAGARLYLAAAADWPGDDILRNADANPNREGAIRATLGHSMGDMAELLRDIELRAVTHVLFLGHVGEFPSDAPETLEKLEFFALLTSHESAWLSHADACLPVACWAEMPGSFVNAQGLLQRFRQVVPAPWPVEPAWKALRKIAEAAGRKLAFETLADLQKGIFARQEVLQGTRTNRDALGRDGSGELAQTTVLKGRHVS